MGMNRATIAWVNKLRNLWGRRCQLNAKTAVSGWSEWFREKQKAKWRKSTVNGDWILIYRIESLRTPNDKAPNCTTFETTCRLVVISRSVSHHKYPAQAPHVAQSPKIFWMNHFNTHFLIRQIKRVKKRYCRTLLLSWHMAACLTLTSKPSVDIWQPSPLSGQDPLASNIHVGSILSGSNDQWPDAHAFMKPQDMLQTTSLTILHIPSFAFH